MNDFLRCFRKNLFSARTIVSVFILFAGAFFLLLNMDLFEGSMRAFGAYMALLYGALMFVLIPKTTLKETGREDTDTYEANRKYTMRKSPLEMTLLVLMFLATPFFMFTVVTKSYGESYSDIIARVATYAGMANIMITGLICLLLYTIFNRFKAAIILASLFNIVFALTNYALILFRGAPLIANDILEIKTAAQVAGAYRFDFNVPTVIAVILTVVWVAAALCLSEDYKLKTRYRLIVVLVCALAFYGFYAKVASGDTLAEHRIKVSGWDPERTYKEHGYYISFLVSFKQSMIKRPAGYSASKAFTMAESYKSDKVKDYSKLSKKHPNIIVIMNESFSDMEIFGKIRTNKEVMPFYKSLKENTIKGTMHSSIYGGHTAVSEFEFQTGFTERFLPLNSIPYTGILGSFNVPSLTWNLKELGYGGITAFHPGRAGAYNRSTVYPLMGFDEYIASRDLVKPHRIRSFASDETDYDRLIEEYEKHLDEGDGTPYYMFNVTIQNHGGFTDDVGEIKPRNIEILDPELKFEETENFLNLMNISDQQFERLIKYFSDAEEPTVILLFGDHQPRLEKQFYKKMRKRGRKVSSLEKQEMKYRTPFFIWANFDIEEEEGIEISANYLSSFLMQKLDAPMTAYQKYLMKLYKKIPVVTEICTIDRKGKMYGKEAKTPYDDLLNEYQIFQYNALSDNKNIISDFFYLDGASSDD